MQRLIIEYLQRQIYFLFLSLKRFRTKGAWLKTALPLYGFSTRSKTSNNCNQIALNDFSRSELEVRLDQAQRDFSHMDERIKFLRAEKSEQFEMVDDLQMELGKAFVIKHYY